MVVLFGDFDPGSMTYGLWWLKNIVVAFDPDELRITRVWGWILLARCNLVRTAVIVWDQEDVSIAHKVSFPRLGFQPFKFDIFSKWLIYLHISDASSWDTNSRSPP